jgi:hypothetical protein
MSVVLSVLALAAFAITASANEGEHARSPSAQADFFRATVVPFLARYCTACHSGAKPKGGLTFEPYKDQASVRESDQKTWRAVIKNLRAHEMPPPSRRRQPRPAEVETLTMWLEQRLTQLAANSRDPGRVTLRRLNCAEYNNTIRDLVGVDFQPADDFPADDVGYGFDNIGDVLSMPPVLMEKYLRAAEKIVDSALGNPQTRKRILGDWTTRANADTERIRRIVEPFASRAYRRPVTVDEIKRLTDLVESAQKNGDDEEASIRLAIEAILVSPHFLFRVELDRASADAGASYPISDFELASRLSYFLWSSMPDEQLFEHARAGNPRNPGVLAYQVRRMMNDPKAKSFVENFAGQWLQIRNLDTAAPDSSRFPDFDDTLRNAMKRETELFFEAVMKEDRSILDFLDARFTFVNERLARHYGIADVKGEQFQRVALADDRRGGVLTQASILTVTSNPTRTSPVKRGKWILENILGTPPPPPPPGAGELKESKQGADGEPLRKRMEQHRTNASCASCHQRMDSLGFGFENFDAIGAWRERDGKLPIDSSGTLPDGQSFQKPQELRAILKAKSQGFCRCLTEKMLTYALGRGLEPYDQGAVDQICSRVAKDDYRFSRLVIEIVNSDPFQKRRGKRGT